MEYTLNDEREVLECPVCFDLFNDCCETRCGHAFCEYCLNKCLEKDLVCPVCRKDPTPIHPSYTVRRIVDKYRSINGLHKEKIHQTNATAQKELGNKLYQQSQYAEAIKHYSEAISATPSGQALSVLYANRAACYFKLKQYLLAIEDCERSAQTDPNYVKAYLRKASCFEQMKQNDKALAEYKEAQKRDVKQQFKEEIDSGISRVSGQHSQAKSTYQQPHHQQQQQQQYYPNQQQRYQQTHPQQQQQQVDPSQIFNQFFGGGGGGGFPQQSGPQFNEPAQNNRNTSNNSGYPGTSSNSRSSPNRGSGSNNRRSREGCTQQ